MRKQLDHPPRRYALVIIILLALTDILIALFTSKGLITPLSIWITTSLTALLWALYTCTDVVIVKNGSWWRWLEGTLFARRNHLCPVLGDFAVQDPFVDGENPCCQSARSDRSISGQKHVEKALRESELKYRTLFEAAGDSILLMHRDRFVDCNARTLAIFSCTREQIIGASPYEFSPLVQPDGQRSEEKALEKIRLAITEGPQSFEWEHCRKDGTLFPAEVSLSKMDLGGETLLLAIVRDITARKRAEQALRQSEATIRSLFNTAPVGVCIMKNREYISANRYWCEQFGYPEETIIGKTTRMLYESDEEWNRVGQELYAHLREKGLASVETKLRRSDGSLREVVVTVAPIRQDDLSAGTIAIIHDMTERKETERALQKSEQMYRELVENANSIILRWNHQGEITFLNKFGLRFFGYTEDEILGRHVVGTIAPKTERGGRDLQQLLDAIARDPEAYEQNINENMRRNGERVWIAWTNKVSRDPQGDVTEVLSIGADITEYRRAIEALRQRDEQFRLIMENLADLVAVLDLRGNRIYNSPSYQSILGDPEKLRGSCSFEEVHPDDRLRVQRTFEETARTGKGQRMEYRLVDLNGQTRYVESQGSVIHDEEGRPSQVLVVSRDVTTRRQAEDAIRELNATLEQRVAERTMQLEAKNKELKAFAYTVSHDLKAPLRGIAGYAEELDRRHCAGMSERALFCLSQVLTASRNLDRLIEDLLHYSRLDAETPSSTEVNLRDLIRLILQDRSLIITEQGVEVLVDIQFETISTWERGLVQVLTNLIDNAIKYSRKANPPRVQIQAEALERSWRLSVSDNGVGFDMKYHDRIYGLFNRLVRVEDFEGTGAGLAIVKKVLDKQGGQIYAESAPGQGATFIVELPKPDHKY